MGESSILYIPAWALFECQTCTAVAIEERPDALSGAVIIIGTATYVLLLAIVHDSIGWKCSHAILGDGVDAY